MKKILKFIYSGTGTTLSVVIFSLVTFAPNWLGQFEGELFPVVTEREIKVHYETLFSSQVEGTFNIVRPGCEFQRLEWRIVSPGRSTLAEVRFPEGSRIRVAGVNEFGPWYVSASKRLLEESSYAIAFHKCPYRPWVTVTRFYP